MKNIEIAKSLISKFNDNNKELYLVGGSVRDYLLFNDFDDFDFSTPLSPLEIIEFLKIDKYDKYAFKFGTVKCKYLDKDIEITSFRKEGAYENNRKPSEVIFIKDLDIDASRRDFTINSLYMDNEKIVDVYKGQEDLKNKIIRSIKEDDLSIKEDALRILRAIRFSLALNFSLSSSLIKSIKNNKNLLLNLSNEKIDQEIKKVLKNTTLSSFEKYLIELELFDIIKEKSKLIK